MRRLARTTTSREGAQWVLLYDTGDGVYAFVLLSDLDGSAVGDDWYENFASAENACGEAYGIRPEDWINLRDPAPGCQQDWILPARVVRCSSNPTQREGLEVFKNGSWVRIDPRTESHSVTWAVQQVGIDGQPLRVHQ